MSLRANAAAPKSVPYPEILKTISLSAIGSTSTASDTGADLTDLATIDGYHEGLLRWEVTVTAGVGATPTAPGASQTFSLFYGFANRAIDALTDAPAILSTSEHSLVCALPNATAVRASGTLTLSANPTDGDLIVIGSVSYVIRNTVSSTYEIKKAASAALTATNIINAINQNAGTAGTDYSSNMAAHPQVTAATGGSGVVTVTAIDYGASGNSIATTEDSAQMGWGASTLTGGDAAGLRIYATDAFLHGGRYLYFWYDRTAFDANAKINVTADLVRI